MTTQWEYNVADFKASDGAKFVADNLNSAGVDGWEVVAATALPDGFYRVIRKRPKAKSPKKARLIA